VIGCYGGSAEDRWKQNRDECEDHPCDNCQGLHCEICEDGSEKSEWPDEESM
jgi:hypothetical protein